jgi:D-alanyl-D-alanine carboxypeptidase (penicillin-binding protein 5/6)
LVVLDSHWSPDEWLHVSAAAAAAEPSRIGLRAGESVHAGDALVAMLVHSANDACAVLVEHAAASQSEFLQRMNQRAQALGMKASHFSSPCGFDASEQYSTAHDLLLLGTAAWQDPLLRYIGGLHDATIHTRAGRALQFQTTNALLGRLDGVVGLKTGFTAGAGQCLIAVAERGSHVVWLVMLGANDRWWGAHRMITAALAQAEAGEAAP